MIISIIVLTIVCLIFFNFNGVKLLPNNLVEGWEWLLAVLEDLHRRVVGRFFFRARQNSHAVKLPQSSQCSIHIFLAFFFN